MRLKCTVIGPEKIDAFQYYVEIGIYQFGLRCEVNHRKQKVHDSCLYIVQLFLTRVNTTLDGPSKVGRQKADQSSLSVLALFENPGS